jgi:hypothetical protein
MPRSNFSLRHHDPFWDLDGAAVRHSRSQRRLFQVGLAIYVLLFVGTVIARLPTFDPQLLTTAEGSLRPVLAVALFALLASCVLAGVARMRVPAEQR